MQTPVIPIIGRWTAETPGTISLGQGIVAYGPPPEADRGGAPIRRRARRSPLRSGRRPAGARRRARRQARRARTASASGRRAASVVTAGGNLAFMNAALAITDPGDEVIFPAPYYFNHEMAVVMAGARPVPVPTDARLPARRRRDRARDRRPHAGRRHRVAEQPDRRRVLGGVAAGRERALPRSRHLSRPRRGLRVLHVRRRAALLAGLDRRRVRPHHSRLLDVEGVRHGELAHRLHGDP